MKIKFTVGGDPKAQARPRFFKVGKRVGTYDPDHKNKKDFASIAIENAPEIPLMGAIELIVVFYIKRPKSHFRTGKYKNLLKENAPDYHTKRPDIDNYIKFVMDSLNGLFWGDDSQVAFIHASKMYSREPRTEITILEI
jgi:Holliday junction resolvase RusA-like endonuclease